MKAPVGRRLLLPILFCLAGSIFWSELILSQKNIVAFKSGWHIYQQNFLNPSIKAQPDFISRKIFSGYRLSSDLTSGVQRIISDSEITPVSFEVLLRMGEDGYFDVITGMNDKSFEGLRISNNPLIPSMRYVSDHNEKYLEVHPFSIATGNGMGKLEGEYKNGELTIAFGGKSIKLPSHSSRGNVGIQISPMNTEIFQVKFRDTEKAYRLNFLPDGPRYTLFLSFLALGFILLFLFGQETLIAYALTGIIFFLADFYVFSFEMKRFNEIMGRFTFIDKISAPTLQEKLAVFKKTEKDFKPIFCTGGTCVPWDGLPIPKTQLKRVVIFGGSQSQICCVRNYNDGFTGNLQRHYPEAEVLNISHHGGFRERLEKTGHLLANSAPDYLLLETIVRIDEKQEIREFIKVWSKKTRVILLRAPQNREKFGSINYEAINEILKKGLEIPMPEELDSSLWLVLRNIHFYQNLRKEADFIFLDPNEVMMDQKINTQGLLWWDNSHLTAFGQEQLAIWLARSLKSIDASSSGAH